MSEKLDIASQRLRLMPYNFEATTGHPSPEDVSRMIIIPFVSSQCVMISLPSGQLCVPEWQEGMGRNYLNGAYLAPLEQAGVRLQQFHPFAQKSDNAQFVAGWIDGHLYETEANRVVVSPEVALARLKEQGNTELADLVQWATKSFRNQTDESYYKDVQILLEESFLVATTVFRGSGFSGDATRWRLARGLIAEAIGDDGTFLDIGCANGLLMESMVEWAAEKGYHLEPYGMDISARLAAVAQKRLPQWADRIFVGNVMFWQPPRKFDFVSTALEYVPEHQRKELVDRLLANFVQEGGRLITTSYGLTKDASKENWSVGDRLRSFGFAVGGEPERFDEARGRLYRIAYINKT